MTRKYGPDFEGTTYAELVFEKHTALIVEFLQRDKDGTPRFNATIVKQGGALMPITFADWEAYCEEKMWDQRIVDAYALAAELCGMFHFGPNRTISSDPGMTGYGDEEPVDYQIPFEHRMIEWTPELEQWVSGVTQELFVTWYSYMHLPGSLPRREDMKAIKIHIAPNHTPGRKDLTY